VPLPALRRVRWAVRATLTFGVAASVAANVLHAWPNPISQAIAAWPPLALLLTVELISRVPMHRRSLAFARLAATAAIAGIAAWVSYWHMAGVASRYGESQTSAYLLPLSVDGLIVVASVCLVELAGRIRELDGRATEQVSTRATEQISTWPTEPIATGPVTAGTVTASTVPSGTVPSGVTRTAAAAKATEPARAKVTESAPAKAAKRPAARPATIPRQRRSVAETAAVAEAIAAAHPGISNAEVARQLGITASRLTAVRREARLQEQRDREARERVARPLARVDAGGAEAGTAEVRGRSDADRVDVGKAA
jgi:hypothetical protein